MLLESWFASLASEMIDETLAGTGSASSLVRVQALMGTGADALRDLYPELRFLRNLNHPDDYRAAVETLAPGTGER